MEVVASSGDLVLVETNSNEKFTGIVMPSNDKNIIVLKLKSGYNIGIEKSKIKDIEIISERKQETKTNEKNEISQNRNLKKILILHTGGTLASKVSYSTGGVVSKFTPEELLAMVPELSTIANIETRLVRNMFSEDMNFNHYNLLTKEIEIELAKGQVIGIIITHGTDTIAYTAAALSFMLQGISIPVLIVGAQRSSDRGSTDAWLNLICAAHFITKSNFKGVAICMHTKSSDEACSILPGTNTRKLHSSRRDAFKPVNTKEIATVFKDGHIIGYEHKEFSSHLKISYLNEKLKVGILKAHPNMLTDELLMYKNFDGMVLEGYGLAGNFPINEIDELTKENAKIYAALEQLAKSMPVVMTTQCIFGVVNMNVYETGRKMQTAGCLGNMSTMTTETAFIKLAWLLSNHPTEVKKLMNQNLIGEISNSLKFDENFI